MSENTTYPTDIARVAGKIPMFFAIIDTNRIDTPPQTRYEFDPMNADALTDSIAREGILSPLLITEQGDRFTLVFGERRLRAAKRLGLLTVPAFVTPTLTPERLLEIQIAENAYRVGLNDIDATYAILQLISVRIRQTPEETRSTLYRIDNQKRRPKSKDAVDPSIIRIVAKTIEEIQPTSNLHLFIRTKLPLLSLPKDIETAYRNRSIDATHAILLGRVKNPITQQRLLNDTAAKEYTVEELRDRIRQATEKPNTAVSDTLREFNDVKKAITPLRFTKFSAKKRMQVTKLVRDLHQVLATDD